MPTALEFNDRINVLRQHIDNLARDERSEIREALRREAELVSLRVYQTLRSNTPERVEDEETYSFRQKAWGKYGVQDYIVQQSPYPAIRQHGMTLRQGWRFPEIDFIGSTEDFINMSINIENVAPHARLVLLGEYNKSSWEIPSTPGQLHGGRKFMMWPGGSGRGGYGFRFKDYPVTIYRPSPLAGPFIAAESELEAARDRFMQVVEETINRSFNNLR